jgi:hypothetical protein
MDLRTGGNQEELLASARRCDQAFHEARKRMFEELIEGADPREAAQRFGQQLEQIAKKFILEGIRFVVYVACARAILGPP